MEAARHCLNRFSAHVEQWIDLEKIERRGLIRDREHERPGLALGDVPFGQRLRQIAERNARLLG
jgi:hypothetical protein